MLYKFNIKMDFKDYYKFNKFHTLKTHYNKKTYIFFRLFIFILFVPFILLTLSDYGYNADGLLMIVPYLIIIALFEIFLKAMLCGSLKLSLKLKKRTGKPAYMPEATLEFYEDNMIEITPQTTSDVKYTMIDSVYIEGNKNIYIYLNNVAAVLLKESDFESSEQRNDFIKFISSKTDKTHYVK